MKKLYVFLLLISGYFTSYSQCSDYTQLLTSGISKINFFDENVGLAYGQGTMIRTTDGGSTWTSVKLPTATVDYETLLNLEILSNDVAIISGNKSTLLKTTDRGLSWQPIALDIQGIEDISGMDFVNSQLGFLVAFSQTNNPKRYLLKTTDGGEHWAKLSDNFLPGIGGTAFNLVFYNEMIGYAWNNALLYKTVDSGNTWSNVILPAHIKELKLTSGGDLIVCKFEGLATLYISTNEGETWVMINDLTYNNNISISSPVFEISNNKIYAVTTNYNVFPFVKNLIDYNLNSGVINSHAINYELGSQTDINVNFNDIYIIDRGDFFWYYTPGRKIIKSENSGLSWVQLDSFTLLNTNTNTFRVLQNTIGTYTASTMSNNSPGTSFFNIYTSTNDGATWNHILKNAANQAYLSFCDGNYISYFRQQESSNNANLYALYESNDLGTTWNINLITNPHPSAFLGNYKQFNQNILIFDNLEYKYISFNKGVTWSLITMPVGINITGIKFIAPNEIYCWGLVSIAPGNNNTYYLYKTVNLGQSWSEILTIPDTNDLPGTIASTTFIFGSSALISTGGHKYFKADLLTGNYQQIPFVNPNSDLDYIPENALYPIDNNKWIFNTSSWGSQYMHVTFDGGLTWNQKDCLVCGKNMFYNESSDQLVTYDSGRGIERFQPYVPEEPAILGNSSVDLNAVESYYVTNNLFATAEWTIQGGTILSNSNPNDYIDVIWETEGIQNLTVKYVNECGESSSTSYSVNVSGSMSSQHADGKNYTVSPNPFNNKISVFLNRMDIEYANVKISNLAGQIVYEKLSEVSEGSLTVEGLQDLAQGVYVITFSTSEGDFSKKAVKY